MSIKEIVLASTNTGKIKEFEQFFNPYNIKIIPQSALNITEVDEPFTTFIENALHKARHCAKYTNLPVLSDDSGLCVTSLNNQPGVFSARYAGEPRNSQANINKLLAQLTNQSNRSAYYYCILVLLRSYDDPQPIISDGVLAGEIIETPVGINGFAYDKHFYIPKHEKTMAQLDLITKNKLSHRGSALNNLIVKLI